MTQYTTGDPSPGESARERFREWSVRPASVTNGHLLASRAVWTAFLAISAFVGYRQLMLDNELTRERVEAAVVREADNCLERNARRDAGRALAVETLVADQSSLTRDQKTLDNDVANWTTIDGLLDGGIPEPARSTIFAGLGQRQDDIERDQAVLDGRGASIDLTYALEPCPPISTGTAPVDE